jgi:putative ABC transport system substrate-binding protein
MSIRFRRREFIAALGGAAAWPLAARAQQAATPVIGYLHTASPEVNISRVAAFRRGLSEVGYVEGLNVAIEYHWGQNQSNRLAELVADLVRRRVSVIATVPSTQAALAAKVATMTVPIVFAIGSDPIALGLVASLNRPGGNATGISFQTVELVAKRLGLLRELAPAATRFVALVNPNAAFADTVVRDLQTSAKSLGLPVEVLRAGTVREIDAAFVDLVQRPSSALLMTPDEFLSSRRAQIVTLAARHALPTIYPERDYSDIGGLMSYGPDIDYACQQAGVYAGRILKGEKPADLPVQQPTKFELVVNLSTAKALAIVIPNTLLALADEVIE